MQYFKKCIMLSTRPERVFADGSLDACQSAGFKHGKTGWQQRRRTSGKVLSQYQRYGSEFDSITPVSGSKYFFYQSLKMGDSYGLNSLSVIHISEDCQKDLTSPGQPAINS